MIAFFEIGIAVEATRALVSFSRTWYDAVQEAFYG
jgi:hypothetical protein